MTMLLSTSGLGLRLSTRWVLRGITIDIAPGSVVALAGPNGCGKTSLLRCLAGLWPVTEGAVSLDDQSLQKLSRAQVARHVSYVPQEGKLEFEFTVREIVLMGRYAHRGRFERETRDDREAAEQAMARADVRHLSERLVTQLSGGERQRVLIARSLASHSRILLLDEPTASLDVDHSLDVLELCRSLAEEGRAVVIATHDLNGASRIADRVALIESGKLIALGSPASVLTPGNLEKAFHVRSEVVSSADGIALLLFHRLGSERQMENAGGAGGF